MTPDDVIIVRCNLFLKSANQLENAYTVLHHSATQQQTFASYRLAQPKIYVSLLLKNYTELVFEQLNNSAANQCLV